MCLFHILNCSARDKNTLRRILTWPSREIIAAGLVRCKWYEAITRGCLDPQKRSKFEDPDVVCPYVVVCHDEIPLPEDVIKGIVEAVYLECVPDHGCADCAETISSHEMLGPLPTKTEKLDYLRAAGRVRSSAIAEAKSASQAGRIAGPSAAQIAGEEAHEARVVKRKNDNEKVAGSKGHDDHAHIVEARPAKKVRKGSSQQDGVQDEDRTVSPYPIEPPKVPPRRPYALQPANPLVEENVPPDLRERSRSSSPALSSTPAGNGRNLSDAVLHGLIQTVRPRSRRHSRNKNEDALQRRREELGIAMATHLSIVATHLSIEAQRSREPVLLDNNCRSVISEKDRKEKEARAMSQPGSNLIDLTKSPTAEPSGSQTESAEPPSTSSEDREEVIREHVRDAFDRLDSAAQQKDPAAHATEAEGGEFGAEVLRGVRDGSFRHAVAEVSRKHWNPDAPPLSPSKASGSKGQTEMLLDSVRILRREKAAFLDRIAGLLEEKAAAMEREAALIRRVVELEGRTGHADNAGEKEKDNQRMMLPSSPRASS
ncbi:uncharacterized protein Z519_12082 [Cladophialophora bantiana CBS 173.52]|uniref:Uncharacterized protein n=1 Tax=Cladophialophora bantiana (strain ATCC 10958 / CBS 173.52 / CDC B-1940 / NIH 8579) TaxID=1442370 RepID=A0A0D2EBG4_CLAB1|nr:uncharacterized protein Z519_12082 [Cladophialophora bantiana CBS 173.52]KIW87446.1 hypothetical protein Z519_12082 [Cladophialophora bantiana CBS 173.52]